MELFEFGARHGMPLLRPAAGTRLHPTTRMAGVGTALQHLVMVDTLRPQRMALVVRVVMVTPPLTAMATAA
jgi:hypothetical protein